jgi:hypothetical protein
VKTLLVLLLAFSSVAFAQAITARNWRSHPAIVEIRRIYTDVNALISAKQLRVASRRSGHCPSWDLERRQFTDSRGVVRRYVKAGGSEDSAVNLEHTYDTRGRLRFVFVRAGAVNDSRLEVRFYFDAAGKRIWTDRRSSGQGYTFSETDFLNEMARDPTRAFAAPLPCR